MNFHINHGLHVPPPEMDITIKSTELQPAKGPNPYTWLFNIRQDPRELRDLATEYPDKIELLKERLTYYSKFIKPRAKGNEIDPEEALKNGVVEPWL